MSKTTLVRLCILGAAVSIAVAGCSHFVKVPKKREYVAVPISIGTIETRTPDGRTERTTGCALREEPLPMVRTYRGHIVTWAIVGSCTDKSHTIDIGNFKMKGKPVDDIGTARRTPVDLANGAIIQIELKPNLPSGVYSYEVLIDGRPVDQSFLDNCPDWPCPF